VLALAAALLGFADGDSPSSLAPPGSTPTDLSPSEASPGMHLEIVSIKGGSSKKGTSFKSGNKLKVKFKLTKDDGSAWDVSEMDQARILVSGPSFNYQRVMA